MVGVASLEFFTWKPFLSQASPKPTLFWVYPTPPMHSLIKFILLKVKAFRLLLSQKSFHYDWNIYCNIEFG